MIILDLESWTLASPRVMAATASGVYNPKAITCFSVVALLFIAVPIVVHKPAVEFATMPSPRTPSSTPSTAKMKRWFELHKELVKDAQRAHQVGTMSFHVYLGDSIFEHLRGTDLGNNSKNLANVTTFFSDFYAEKAEKQPLVLAISGDQTQHLLWRIQHGEISRLLSGKEITYIMLIGTNNIRYGHSAIDIAEGIWSVAKIILNRAAGHLVISNLLPRDDMYKNCVRRITGKCDEKDPNGQIMEVNEIISRRVHKARKDGNPVALAECGHLFSSHAHIDGRKFPEVNASLMPDLLHPSVEGYKYLLPCLHRAANSIVATKKLMKEKRQLLPQRMVPESSQPQS